MSLLNAKRLAELRGEIDVASNGLSELHKDFRKQINDKVIGEFTEHLESNGFTVTSTQQGALGEYKDLKIKLVLAGPTDRYIGIYHSFDILVNDKKKSVTVLTKFSGIPDRPSVRSGDSVQLLEQDLQLINEEVENIKLVGFKYDCAQPPINPREPRLIKESIAEVIDVFLA